jgi:hypothetical protein
MLVVMVVFIGFRLLEPYASCHFTNVSSRGAREIKLAFTESKDHAASSL